MKPFRIHFPDTVLEDLHRRLKETRWPAPVESGWSYGTDLAYLKEFCKYWRTDFDWRAQETLLNRFNHFTTQIEGLNLHFIHQRSALDTALPLLLVHGWPGSILEFVKIIEPLTDPMAHGARAEDAFHVVCVSLPGFGFSDSPTETGFDIRQAARSAATLMARLGYARYGVQGGDWGASVASWLGAIDAGHVCGIHLNLVGAGAPEESGTPDEDPGPEEIAFLGARRDFMRYETGYRHIQSTKPLTLGYGLNDSPAGLAAWLIEKFRAWSDCGGDVESRFSRDELLANITIYWATQTIESSMRIYFETRKSKNFYPRRVDVPTGCAIFPKEILNVPRRWAERVYNIERWTEMPFGGHFAALEAPELLVEDIRSFYQHLR